MIVALEEAKYKLTGMRPVVAELGNALRIEELKVKVEELEAQTLDPDFWSNQENSSKVLQAIKQAKDTVANYEALCARLEDAIALGCYNIDIHNPTGTGTYIYYFLDGSYYSIPYRSLLPKEYDNMLYTLFYFEDVDTGEERIVEQFT